MSNIPGVLQFITNRLRGISVDSDLTFEQSLCHRVAKTLANHGWLTYEAHYSNGWTRIGVALAEFNPEHNQFIVGFYKILMESLVDELDALGLCRDGSKEWKASVKFIGEFNSLITPVKIRKFRAENEVHYHYRAELIMSDKDKEAWNHILDCIARDVTIQ